MIARIFVITTIAATLASGALAHNPSRRHHAQRMSECLQISPEQKDAMRELRQREREASRPIREELKNAALEYKALSDKNDPEAGAQLARIRDIRDELAARRLAVRAEVERVLTPEQRERAEQCRAERRGR